MLMLGLGRGRWAVSPETYIVITLDQITKDARSAGEKLVQVTIGSCFCFNWLRLEKVARMFYGQSLSVRMQNQTFDTQVNVVLFS